MFHFHSIDVGYLNLPGAANAFLLPTEAGPVLIETGPQACLSALERGLRAHAVDPKSIAHVFVTHIHLDHAGAAGAFAARGATVHVHPFGARHLVDPSKLIASSRRVHGEGYERFYGDPLPAPEVKVIAEPDGARIDLGSIAIEAIETPGHARHHHAWLVKTRADDERAGGVLFTGDAAATLVPGSRFIGIPTPPPEYDRDAWLHALDRMVARAPTHLVLTHGGLVSEPQQHLASVRTRLLAEHAWLRAALENDPDDAEVLPRYRAWLHAQADQAGVPAHARDAFIGDTWMVMNIAGMRRAMAAK